MALAKSKTTLGTPGVDTNLGKDIAEQNKDRQETAEFNKGLIESGASYDPKTQVADTEGYYNAKQAYNQYLKDYAEYENNLAKNSSISIDSTGKITVKAPSLAIKNPTFQKQLNSALEGISQNYKINKDYKYALMNDSDETKTSEEWVNDLNKDMEKLVKQAMAFEKTKDQVKQDYGIDYSDEDVATRAAIAIEYRDSTGETIKVKDNTMQALPTAIKNLNVFKNLEGWDENSQMVSYGNLMKMWNRDVNKDSDILDVFKEVSSYFEKGDFSDTKEHAAMSAFAEFINSKDPDISFWGGAAENIGQAIYGIITGAETFWAETFTNLETVFNKVGEFSYWLGSKTTGKGDDTSGYQKLNFWSRDVMPAFNNWKEENAKNLRSLNDTAATFYTVTDALTPIAIELAASVGLGNAAADMAKTASSTRIASGILKRYNTTADEVIKLTASNIASGAVTAEEVTKGMYAGVDIIMRLQSAGNFAKIANAAIQSTKAIQRTVGVTAKVADILAQAITDVVLGDPKMFRQLMETGDDESRAYALEQLTMNAVGEVAGVTAARGFKSFGSSEVGQVLTARVSPAVYDMESRMGQAVDNIKTAVLHHGDPDWLVEKAKKLSDEADEAAGQWYSRYAWNRAGRAERQLKNLGERRILRQASRQVAEFAEKNPVKGDTWEEVLESAQKVNAKKSDIISRANIAINKVYQQDVSSLVAKFMQDDAKLKGSLDSFLESQSKVIEVENSLGLGKGFKTFDLGDGKTTRVLDPDTNEYVASGYRIKIAEAIRDHSDISENVARAKKEIEYFEGVVKNFEATKPDELVEAATDLRNKAIALSEATQDLRIQQTVMSERELTRMRTSGFFDEGYMRTQRVKDWLNYRQNGGALKIAELRDTQSLKLGSKDKFQDVALVLTDDINEVARQVNRKHAISMLKDIGVKVDVVADGNSTRIVKEINPIKKTVTNKIAHNTESLVKNDASTLYRDTFAYKQARSELLTLKDETMSAGGKVAKAESILPNTTSMERRMFVDGLDGDNLDNVVLVNQDSAFAYPVTDEASFQEFRGRLNKESRDYLDYRIDSQEGYLYGSPMSERDKIIGQNSELFDKDNTTVKYSKTQWENATGKKVPKWAERYVYDDTVKVADEVATVEPQATKSAAKTSAKPVEGEKLTDRLGFTFTTEDVPVSKLTRNKEFQPRTTASGKATENSVFEKGYNEGMVDQPMLVRKNGDKYEVLGGHSRTLGLERRSAAGLSNPENVKARVYEGISDAEAKQISRAANQGAQYEDTMDMAKSISESITDGAKPAVQKNNMVKGTSYQDYDYLWKMSESNPTVGNKIKFGAIPQDESLLIAKEGLKCGLKPEKTMGIIAGLDNAGKFSRQNANNVIHMVSGKMKSAAAKSAQANLFGDIEDAIVVVDELADFEKKRRELVSVRNSIKKIGKYDPDTAKSLKETAARAEKELENLGIEINDKIASGNVKKTTRTKRAQNINTEKYVAREIPGEKKLSPEEILANESAKSVGDVDDWVRDYDEAEDVAAKSGLLTIKDLSEVDELRQMHESMRKASSKVPSKYTLENFEKVVQNDPDFITDLKKVYASSDSKIYNSEAVKDAAARIKQEKEIFDANTIYRQNIDAIRKFQSEHDLAGMDRVVMNQVNDFIDNAVRVNSEDKTIMNAMESLADSTVSKDEALEYATMRSLNGSRKKIENEVFSQSKGQYNAMLTDFYKKKFPGKENAEIRKKMLNSVDRQAAEYAKQTSKLVADKIEQRYGEIANKLMDKGSSIVDKKGIFARVSELNEEITGAIKSPNVIKTYDANGFEEYVELSPTIASMFTTMPRQLRVGQFGALQQSFCRLFRIGTTGGLVPGSLVNQAFKDTGNMLVGGDAWKSSSAVEDELTRLFGDRFAKEYQETVPDVFDTLLKRSEETGEDVNRLIVKREMERGAMNIEPELESNLYQFGREGKSAKRREGLYTQTTMDKVQGAFDKAVEKTDTLNNIRETALRKRVYNNNLLKGMKQGMSIQEARNLAEFMQSEATTNFIRQSYHLANLTKTVPYLGSAINGAKSFWRLYAFDPVGVTTRIVGGYVVPVIALTGMTLSNDEDRRIYQQIPEYEKANSIVFVINGQIISIPVPQEISSFVTPVQHMVESIAGTSKNSFAELMANDLLGSFPIDLSGFINIDADNLLEQDFFSHNLIPGFAKVSSTLMSPLEKSAFMYVTGVDPYTMKPISRNNVQVDNETGEQYIMDQHTSETAKWIGSIAGDFMSAPMAQKVLQNLFGKGGIMLTDSIGQLAQAVGKPDTSLENIGKIGQIVMENATKNLTVERYGEESNIAWNREVARLWEEKNALTDGKTEKSRKYINDLKLLNSNDATEEAKKEAEGRVKTIQQEFMQHVLDASNNLVSKYSGTFDKNKFASVLSLMNLDSGSVNQLPFNKYSTYLNQQDWNVNRAAAVETMAKMGFRAAEDSSIFGYFKENDDGSITIQYNSPLNILNYNYSSSYQDEIAFVDINTIVRDEGLYDKKQAVQEQIDALYKNNKKLSNADKAKKEQIQINWNAEVASKIAPVVAKMTPEAAINNKKVRDLLRTYIIVPDSYMTNNKNKRVYSSTLGDDGSLQDAYYQSWIKRMFSVNDKYKGQY